MPHLVSVVLLAVCGSGYVSAENARRVCPCFRPAHPPAVDGNIREDPVWRSLPVVTGFSVLGGTFTLAKQTEVQACWDDDALYLAFVCEEPDAAVMKFKIRDGGDAWLDDSVEIFLQPGGPGKQVYQFIITGRGARGAFEGAPDFTKVQAAARRTTDSYSLEIRIPFSILEGRPEPGARWRGVFCRNIFTTRSGGDKFTSWVPLQRRFLEPEHFGELVFRSGRPAPDALQALNSRLNRDYRQSLMKMVEGAARLAQGYLPALNGAARDPKFRTAATDLLARWKRVQAASALAGKTDLHKLRIAARDAGTLPGDSDEVKYRYLIHKLLTED